MAYVGATLMVARVPVHRASLAEEGQTPGGRPSRSPLQFTRSSSPGTRWRRVVSLRHRHNIPNTQLHLQVAIGGAVIMRKEHQSVIGDYISLICVARENHLAPDSLLGGSDGHFLTFFIQHKPARIASHITMGPEHQSDSLTFQALLPHALTQVIGEFTNSGTG